MSIQLPQIWGRHDTANIDGVMVGGRFITTVTDQPEAWEARLATLGFRQTTSGWAKIGVLGQAEYQFLSPEISLVGFRPEFGIDLELPQSNEPVVPYEVQDSLLGLWSRRQATIDVAMVLEHGQRLSHGRLWSVIEEALSGSENELTITLYGLAIAHLQQTVGLSAEVESFAARQKALAAGEEPPAARGPGRALLQQGEIVEWADRHGFVHESRLARPVRVEDGGFWIYPNPQRWVAGYPVVTPMRMPRTALIFRGSGDQLSWEQEHQPVPETAASASRQGLLDPNEAKIPSADFAIVAHAIASKREMHGQDWEEALRSCFQYDAAEQHIPEERIERTIEWVRRIKAQLAVESSITYGEREPMQFALVRHGEQGREYALGVAASPTIRGQVVTAGSVSVPLFNSGLDEVDLTKACAEAEAERRQHENMLRFSSRELGIAIGTGPAFPIQQVWGAEGCLLEWRKANGGALREDDLYRMASTLMRDRSVFKRINHSSHETRDFEFELRDPYSGGLLVSIGLRKIDDMFLTVDDILTTVSGCSELPPGWSHEIGRQARRYAVMLAAHHPEWQQLEVEGVLLAKQETGFQARYRGNSYYATLDEALSKYAATLAEMKPALPEALRSDADEMIQRAARYPLYQRLLAVPAKLRGMDADKLQALVLADVLRVGQGRFDGWDQKTLDNIIKRIVEVTSNDNVSGVMLTLTPRQVSFNRVQTTLATVMETREGAIGKAVTDLKNGRRRSVLALDSVAWADPELATLINGDAAPGLLKESEKGTPADSAADRYEDTGVVAGFAMKDIRGFSKDQLISCSSSMSDSQKQKYLTKDNLWARKSFQELFEAGVSIQVAYVRDLIWKAMPGKPKSLARDHVQAFIDLLSAFKEADKSLSGTLEQFEQQVRMITRGVFANSDSPYAHNTYNRRDLMVRGFRGISLKEHGMSFSSDSRMVMKLASIQWSELIKEKVAKKTTSTGSRVQRDVLERTGPDYRNGQSVTGEDFIKTFGFSGVEYGNWTNQKEREKHLNFAYDSMMDFVRIMGWEPMTLSLGGKLGLCIGSRGRGGKNPANAHFEPINMAINLTRMRGDGALAHEFFHAVANHFGRLYRGAAIDLADALAYPLTNKRPSLIAPEVTGGIRQQVATSFYYLMTSIIRAPQPDGDWKDPQQYTQKSAMYIAGEAQDKAKKRVYWSQPAEMFARAMEIWVKDRLADNNERNDYLVRAGKGDGDAAALYPDADHLTRINHFVSDWLEAVETEMKSVTHPFLGPIEMPVLYSGHKSRQPLAARDLQLLADQDLRRIFAEHAPHFRLDEDPTAAPGLYDLSRDLITLSTRHADEGTFYHEVWHAAHDKLLSWGEQRGLQRVFAPGGALARHIAGLMEEQGMADAVPAMMADTREIQAYAFQLWTQGVFDFSAYLEVESFERTRGFADGVVDVIDTFGLETVQRLFEELQSGRLAQRKGVVAEQQNSGLRDGAPDGADWDDDNLYWNPGLEEEARPQTQGAPGMR